MNLKNGVAVFANKLKFMLLIIIQNNNDKCVK